MLALFLSLGMMVTSVFPASSMVYAGEVIEKIEAEDNQGLVSEKRGSATDNVADKDLKDNSEEDVILEAISDEEEILEDDSDSEIIIDEDSVEDMDSSDEEMVEIVDNVDGAAGGKSAGYDAPLFKFNFNDAAKNAAITDSTGKAKATGTYDVVTDLAGGKAIKLTQGSKQFLSITDKDGKSILDGYNEITLSYESIISSSATNWPFYIAKNSSANNEATLAYLGGLHKAGELTVERFYEGRQGSAACTSTKGLSTTDWSHIDIVFSTDKTEIYINGQREALKEFSSDICQIADITGPTSIIQLGKANWGSGEYTSAQIDNFTIYGCALTEEEVAKDYQAFMDAVKGEDAEATDLSLNAGFVSEDFELPSTFGGKDIEWTVSGNGIAISEGKAIVTRDPSDNQEATLTATYGAEEKKFNLTVLKGSESMATYVSKKPIEGQGGGMKAAIKAAGDTKYNPIHKDQPIMYTAVGGKAYDSPSLFRKKDGKSFGMVAVNKGQTGGILLYDSKDLTSYTNEKAITITGVSKAISKLDLVYDTTDKVYKLFMEDSFGAQYKSTSTDLETFTEAEKYPYNFNLADNLPEDAKYGKAFGITKEESDKLLLKFTNPKATSVFTRGIPTVINIDKASDLQEELAKVSAKAEIRYEYNDGTGYKSGKTYNYGIHWNNSELAKLEGASAGTYTIHGYIGGDSYYVEADDPLILERADPYITYDEESKYYYFTASYPMYGGNDAEGYDRLVLRRAKTINELATAEEYTIWDEKDHSNFSRFIWAPEIHKIGDDWYYVATAKRVDKGGNNFNIRPFMVKYEGTKWSEDNDKFLEEFINPEKWGEPKYVKAMSGDEKNILDGMSLDMTYFEAGGNHYLAWPDETKTTVNPDGLSAIFIATIDPANPAQLTSKAVLLTQPEYSWERVRYNVNEGPAALLSDDGKTVYLCFSAAGTGSEYCVGYLSADADADLTKIENWTKCPYPILTSGDFNNELSGPGHNSFTRNANNEPIICFHARPAAAHATGTGSHSGDPLYDPCRSAYIRPVFYDVDGVPILNLSDEDFAKDGSEFEVTLKINGNDYETEAPILAYDFNKENVSGNKIKNIAPVVESTKDLSLDGIMHAKKNNFIVKDKKYGDVLYTDGDTGYNGTQSYFEFPKRFFDGRDQITISMDVNEISKTSNYQTFMIGKDANNYISMKMEPTSIQSTIKVGDSTKTAAKSGTYPNHSRDWVNVKVVINSKSISLYRNGKLIATRAGTTGKVSDMGEDLIGYLGRSFNENDIFYRGMYDNVKVYGYAMTDEQVKAAYEADEAARLAEISDLDYVADNYEIPNIDDIRGNITLLDEVNGVKISWTSSDESVINTKDKELDNPTANYTKIPKGVVTRGDKDKKVKLTATFEKGGNSRTKEYEATVKAKPEEVTPDDYTGYLFVHFTGETSLVEDNTREQVFLSASRDGKIWMDLNDNEPIEEMISDLGESGTRDHFIARSPEGDKFYMIATDLSIYHGLESYDERHVWGDAGGNGSHSIVVWESTDLVNWSKPWLSEIARVEDTWNSGCTWAPEFQYDYKTGEYVVFWASTGLETDGNGNITQDYENHTIYYAKTRDFRTYTKPKVFHEGGMSGGKVVKVIDSTMIYNDGMYYRYTKNESTGKIEIDKSKDILGTYTDIPSSDLKTRIPDLVGALEGPIIYKLNKNDTKDGEDTWCLMADQFGTGKGYYPMLTTDLNSGKFSTLDNKDYSFPTKFRHGYVMPVTEKEYTAIQKKWGAVDNLPTVSLKKSNSGNPMLGFDADGNIMYGGDPSILVDGDTVYAYVGQDVSKTAGYNMPDWKCYSSTDMKNWKYESTILTCNPTNVKWAADDFSAWAGQVMKYKDKYYFYFCTETNSKYGGGKSIGVAVSDSPTGPFTDIGKPLVRNIDTYNGVSTWEDIDPTAWIETDENGVEHRILGWGNSRFFNCELNEDMISIKDRDGDPSKITCELAKDMPNADIKVGVLKNHPKANGNGGFTEAPYYYRQQDANGNYFGKYYIFFAFDWREEMAYATADTLEQMLNNEWDFGGILMRPSSTANTNHMAVFDFKGQTYFVYHDGSLPWGSGFRRVACVEKMMVKPDGTIDPIRMTATGLTGTLSKIQTLTGKYVASVTYENSTDDADYSDTNPEVNRLYHYADTLVSYEQNGYESGWEINKGKINPTSAAYVSIESDYKPGMYLSAGLYNKKYTGDIPVYIAQDVLGTGDEAQRMTFKTLKGFDETVSGAVTFESVRYPGYFLANKNGKLVLTKNYKNAYDVTFTVSDYTEEEKGSAVVQKTKRMYKVGEKLNTDDIRILVTIDDAVQKVPMYVTNASTINMSTSGEKTLEVTFDVNNVSYTETVKINVVAKGYK